MMTPIKTPSKAPAAGLPRPTIAAPKTPSTVLAEKLAATTLTTPKSFVCLSQENPTPQNSKPFRF